MMLQVDEDIRPDSRIIKNEGARIEEVEYEAYGGSRSAQNAHKYRSRYE
jgi:hypothetical protein